MSRWALGAVWADNGMFLLLSEQAQLVGRVKLKRMDQVGKKGETEGEGGGTDRGTSEPSLQTAFAARMEFLHYRKNA